MVTILLAVPLACTPVAFFGRLGRINEASGSTTSSGRVLKFKFNLKLPVASRGPVTLFFWFNLY